MTDGIFDVEPLVTHIRTSSLCSWVTRELDLLPVRPDVKRGILAVIAAFSSLNILEDGEETVKKCLDHYPLSPLTFEDWEWEPGGWNKRWPSVIRQHDGRIRCYSPFSIYDSNVQTIVKADSPLFLYDKDGITTGGVIIFISPSRRPWLPPCKRITIRGAVAHGYKGMEQDVLKDLEQHYQFDVFTCPGLAGWDIRDDCVMKIYEKNKPD